MKILIILVMLITGLQFIEADKEPYSILYFYNPDCPSCREIEPFVNYLQEEYDLKIFRYNTRTSIGLRYGFQYRIQYVPTMIIIVGSDEQAETKRYVGIEPIRNAEKFIAELATKENKELQNSSQDNN